MTATTGTIGEISERFGAGSLHAQPTKDGVPTVWVGAERFRDVLAWLKSGPGGSYSMLLDITAIDEREPGASGRSAAR